MQSPNFLASTRCKPLWVLKERTYSNIITLLGVQSPKRELYPKRLEKTTLAAAFDSTETLPSAMV